MSWNPRKYLLYLSS